LAENHERAVEDPIGVVDDLDGIITNCERPKQTKRDAAAHVESKRTVTRDTGRPSIRQAKYDRRDPTAPGSYRKRIVDAETGELIHENCPDESLAEHRGHGSAKDADEGR